MCIEVIVRIIAREEKQCENATPKFFGTSLYWCEAHLDLIQVSEPVSS